VVKEGDNVVDMTCGRGRDSVFLALLSLFKDSGTLVCMDIQQEALDSTYAILCDKLSVDVMNRVKMCRDSHENVLKYLIRPVKLFVYNLGYLPCGDKAITTKAITTINSLKIILPIIYEDKGFISLMVYPGHVEGEEELKALMVFFKELDIKRWDVCHHVFSSKERAPSLFWIKPKLRQ
jgi:hypothetical protein